MGKSTLAAMMARMGIPVHDSDEAAREVIAPGTKGAQDLHAIFPYFEYPQIYGRKTKDGRRIDRRKLAALVFGDHKNADRERKKLEALIHPLVRQSQDEFVKLAKRSGHKMACLDIPLLFETGAEGRVDHTIVVTAPPHIQKRRVLSRPGMTKEDFEKRLARQMPDREKCARADYVIHTGLGRAQTMKELKAVLAEIQNLQENADLAKEKIYDP